MPTPTPMTFTYYIAATPEKVWDGFISPDINRTIFMGANFTVDLTPGGAMLWTGPGPDGKTVTYVRGEVIQAEAPKLLQYYFRMGDNGKPSRVTITFTPETEAIKVVVTQDEWQDDDSTYAMNADGWPRVLSRLKTLLETGKTFKPH